MKSIELLLLLFLTINAVESFDQNLKQTFETALDDDTISDPCRGALEQYVENLSAESDQWAIQMLDATSKLPVGILSYNFGDLGQFDQCLKIESEDGLIKGKYCLGTLTIQLNSAETPEDDSEAFRQVLAIQEASKRIAGIRTFDNDNDNLTSSTQLGMSWALCLPAACSNDDVSLIFYNLLGSKGAICQTKEDLTPPLTHGAIATIVVLAFFVCLLVTSTALDIYYMYYKKSESPHIILTAFSMYSNGKKLFRISKNSNELTCLNGMRFYSMMWVIIGHVFTQFMAQPLLNSKDLLEWVNTLRSMVIVSGTLSVDTFFMMAGLLIVYGYFKSQYQGKKFNIFLFYIHRYLRLTPPLAAAILVNAHLLKYMGTGPLWNSINTFEDACRKYWWTTLLYIQNYANDDNGMCLGQSWYLSVDMQLYIISPLVLIPLWKYPKIGIGLVITEILTFIIVPFCIGYVNELPGLISNILASNNNNFMTLYYLKTHTRAAPWFIGALLGYILAKIKFKNEHRHPRLNKFLVIFLWMATIVIGLTCVFGGHDTLGVPEYDVWGNSFYIALVRPTWAICLSWVIFACVSGYGGPINWFLSLPIYQVLNRFTYSMYLIHYNLLFVLAFTAKTGVYFNEFNVALSFWGVTMLTFGLSVLWVLTFESPVVIIEKILFGGSSSKNNKQLQENGNKSGMVA